MEFEEFWKGFVEVFRGARDAVRLLVKFDAMHEKFGRNFPQIPVPLSHIELFNPGIALEYYSSLINDAPVRPQEISNLYSPLIKLLEKSSDRLKPGGVRMEMNTRVKLHWATEELRRAIDRVNDELLVQYSRSSGESLEGWKLGVGKHRTIEREGRVVPYVHGSALNTAVNLRLTYEDYCARANEKPSGLRSNFR